MYYPRIFALELESLTQTTTRKDITIQFMLPKQLAA